MKSTEKIKRIDWSLYAIIDKEWLKGRPLQGIVEQIIRGGAGVIQYRDKVSESGAFYRAAQTLRRITAEHQILFIVNDRVDIALGVGADGIHLGQNDLPVDVVREIVGDEMILGSSVHIISEFDKVRNADYFGVGAVYPTRTKEKTEIGGIEIVRQIRARTQRPIVGIGGITPENLGPVIRAGADGVAVISALLDADDVEGMARRFVEAVQNAKTEEVSENGFSGDDQESA